MYAFGYLQSLVPHVDSEGSQKLQAHKKLAVLVLLVYYLFSESTALIKEINFYPHLDIHETEKSEMSYRNR